MAEVTITYKCPVDVTVDLDTGRVTRVVAVDESIDMDEPTVQNAASAAERIRALAIVERRDWPTWQNAV